MSDADRQQVQTHRFAPQGPSKRVSGIRKPVTGLPKRQSFSQQIVGLSNRANTVPSPPFLSIYISPSLSSWLRVLQESIYRYTYLSSNFTNISASE